MLHVRGALPIRGGREHPYLRRQRDTEKNLNKQTLLSFPQLSTYPLTYFIPSQLSTLQLIHHKKDHFIWSSFPYGGSHVMSELNQINLYAFLLLICLCQFNFQTQPVNLRGSRKIFSLPYTCKVLSRVPTPCKVLIHDSYYYHHDAFSSTPFLSSQMGLRLA